MAGASSFGCDGGPSWKLPSAGAFGGLGHQSAEASESPFDWDPDVFVEDEEEELREQQQAELEVGDLLFSDEEIMAWSGREAILWIAKAATAFEVFGLRPKRFDGRALLRKRYRKLSLLTHPDKNADEDAGPAFRKVADAMRILSDEDLQAKLLQRLFPKDAAAGASASAAGGGQADGIYASSSPSAAGEGAAERSAPEKAQEDLEAALKAALQEKKELKQKDQAWKELIRKRHSLVGLAPGSTRVGGTGAEAGSGPSTAKRRRRPSAAAEAPGARWGLPEAFRPPAPSPIGQSAATSSRAVPQPRVSASPAAATAKEAGGAANPQLLWELAGDTGLAANGWQRHESRGHPGKFYFMHKATGRTIVGAAPAPRGPPLPSGWERRESRSRPGVFYYANVATGETRMAPPPPQAADASGEAASNSHEPPISGGESAHAADEGAGAGSASVGDAVDGSGQDFTAFEGAWRQIAAAAISGAAQTARAPWPWEVAAQL